MCQVCNHNFLSTIERIITESQFGYPRRNSTQIYKRIIHHYLGWQGLCFDRERISRNSCIIGVCFTIFNRKVKVNGFTRNHIQAHHPLVRVISIEHSINRGLAGSTCENLILTHIRHKTKTKKIQSHEHHYRISLRNEIHQSTLIRNFRTREIKFISKYRGCTKFIFRKMHSHRKANQAILLDKMNNVIRSDIIWTNFVQLGEAFKKICN